MFTCGSHTIFNNGLVGISDASVRPLAKNIYDMMTSPPHTLQSRQARKTALKHKRF